MLHVYIWRHSRRAFCAWIFIERFEGNILAYENIFEIILILNLLHRVRIVSLFLINDYNYDFAISGLTYPNGNTAMLA